MVYTYSMGSLMDNLIVLIAFTLAGCFAFAYLVTLFKINKINKSFTKLLISHTSLQEFIDNNNVEFKNESDIHKENFIKFLSDSRDWSFSYIEDVQNNINKIIEDLKKDVEFFEKYEAMFDGHPSQEILAKFVNVYRDLEKLLPEDQPK